MTRSKKNGNGYSKAKYKNKKIIIDGITFASLSEGQRYVDLKEMQACGDVISFEIQPEFVLQPSFIKKGKTIRAIKYVADFKVIRKDGTVHIEDVKGSSGFMTEVFRIKHKLFEYKFPDLELEIVLVPRKKKP
jgi:hypothetical protein